MAVKTSAEPFLPPRLNLKSLREAAEHCQGCDLYKNATQTVFGEGPRRAPLILLGEVPGDEEDNQGQPFVGPLADCSTKHWMRPASSATTSTSPTP